MSNFKPIAQNRKARFDYEILEVYEAGVVLTGTEIKSIREGRVNLSQSYAKPDAGEIWLHNTHIAEYSHSGRNYIDLTDPTRPRKLLLHKSEIRKLTTEVSQKGQTIVPIKLYFKKQLVKVQLGLARGRKRFDKRRVSLERQREKDARFAIKRLL
jgi:SsrA-binding protein